MNIYKITVVPRADSKHAERWVAHFSHYPTLTDVALAMRKEKKLYESDLAYDHYCDFLDVCLIGIKGWGIPTLHSCHTVNNQWTLPDESCHESRGHTTIERIKVFENFSEDKETVR